MISTVSIAFGIMCCVAPLIAQPISESELSARHNLNQSRYSFLDNGPDLLVQARDQGKDVTRTISVNVNEASCTDCGPIDDTDHWRVKQAARESDLVAVGVISRNTSLFTKNRALLFTDSEFIVEDVWKSTRDSHVASGSEITVTTVGGSVVLDHHVITATVSGTPLFEKGDRYLLFLKYIPESRSYEPVSLFGFDVTGATVLPMRKRTSVPGRQYLNNLSNFMQAMRQSTENAFKEETK